MARAVGVLQIVANQLRCFRGRGETVAAALRVQALDNGGQPGGDGWVQRGDRDRPWLGEVLEHEQGAAAGVRAPARAERGHDPSEAEQSGAPGELLAARLLKQPGPRRLRRQAAL